MPRARCRDQPGVVVNVQRDGASDGALAAAREPCELGASGRGPTRRPKPNAQRRETATVPTSRHNRPCKRHPVSRLRKSAQPRRRKAKASKGQGHRPTAGSVWQFADPLKGGDAVRKHVSSEEAEEPHLLLFLRGNV